LNYKPIFVMGLISSILGILGSFLTGFLVTFFVAGIADYNQPISADITTGAMTIGLTVAIIQGLITLFLCVMTLIKSKPSSLEKGLKNSGIWLLTCGIILIFVNIFQLVSIVLNIIAGIMAISESNKQKNQENMLADY